MKTLRLFYLTILLLTFPLFGYCKTCFISLGLDCQAAYQLSNFNLRSLEFPFDWMVSLNFSGIILAIDDNCESFLDPSVLIYKETYVENSYYQFGYNHFFPLIGKPIKDEVFVPGTIVPNFLDYLPNVKSIQKKKIDNLFFALNLSQNFIVFLRTHSNPEEAQIFVKFIKKKYPNLKFLLAVIHDKKELNNDWVIHHVVNFYVTQLLNPENARPQHNWWHEKEWAIIFKQLNQLSRYLNTIK
ncbi:MAG: DUF1796 family putative cysteine peptidase [Parachlamydiaceae bacterium]|nr:DUF1796 family putative cysteine peptidase [Parachlamydiaceae bacterium]